MATTMASNYLDPPSTTIVLQTSETVFIGRNAASLSAVTTYPEVTLSNGFTLYLPYTTTAGANVNYNTLVASLNNGTSLLSGTLAAPPVYVSSGIWSALPTDPVSTLYNPAFTLYVPVITHLSPTVMASTLFNVLSVPIESNSRTVESSTTSATGVQATTTASSPAPKAQKFSAGDVAGGTLGGFLAGCILCGCITLLCFRNRLSNLEARRNTSRPSLDQEPSPVSIPDKEKIAVSVESADVVGWRKHLLQEKDVGKIARSFSDVFEQAQMHLEYYYQGKASKPSSSDVARLHNVAAEDMTATLVQTTDALLILKAILIRWMVNGVCLADGGASLLPPEYTGVPKKAGWRMVNDDRNQLLTVESRKGFLPAFSQWRALTGFLYQDPASDHGFQKDLDHDIDKAVTLFAEAFEPWESKNLSDSSREENLRNIFHLASNAGIELFKQASTFMFDWQGKSLVHGGKLVITPALVRRLDEQAQLLRPAEIVLQSKEGRINWA